MSDEQSGDDVTVEASTEQLAEIRRLAAERNQVAADEAPAAAHEVTVDVSPEQLAEIRQQVADGFDSTEQLDDVDEDGTTVGPDSVRAEPEVSATDVIDTDAIDATVPIADVQEVVSTPDTDDVQADEPTAEPLPDEVPASSPATAPVDGDAHLPVWTPPPRLKTESHQVAEVVADEAPVERSGLPLWVTAAAVVAAVVITALIVLLVSGDEPAETIDQALAFVLA